MDTYKRMIDIIEKIINVKIPQEFNSTIRCLFSDKQLSKSKTLLSAGDTAYKTYILVSGLMRSYYIDDAGNDITQYFIEPGDIFGFTSFTGTSPSDVYIETFEDCILLEADGHAFLETLSSNNFALICWLKILEGELKFKAERQSSYLLGNATERYLDFKKAYPGIEDRVNQKYIASYLGITPVSLSRLRNSLN